MNDHQARGLTPDDLVALNRSSTVARLLSGAAHEVNNALQIIGGTVDLLEERPDASEPVLRGLHRIRSQTMRAAGVITEVLAFAREDPAAVGRLNLRQLAARVVSLRTFSIRRAGLEIIFSAPETDIFIVNGSRVQLTQALLNLIVNAEQSLAGQSGGEIRLEMHVDGPWSVIEVADNGPGIQAGLRERALDPFVTTREGTDAAGLGLTAAHTVACRHGGSLTLAEADAGARFILRLPAGR